MSTRSFDADSAQPSPPLEPATRAVSRRQRAAASAGADHRGGGAAEEHAVHAALDEAEAALAVVKLADVALDEVSFLLRRLRSVAVQAALPAVETPAVTLLQDQVFRLVSEISCVLTRAHVEGVVLFDGGLVGQQVILGRAGQPVEVSVPALNARGLGLERPWGHANKASGVPARLAASSGTLPSGIFRVCDGEVFDESGAVVARYEGDLVEFGDGVTATFDRSLYYRDDASSPQVGTFTLNSVLSVRNARAAQQALTSIGDALSEVSRRRTALLATRGQLADAVALLRLLVHDAEPRVDARS